MPSRMAALRAALGPTLSSYPSSLLSSAAQCIILHLPLATVLIVLLACCSRSSLGTSYVTCVASRELEPTHRQQVLSTDAVSLLSFLISFSSRFPSLLPFSRPSSRRLPPEWDCEKEQSASMAGVSGLNGFNASPNSSEERDSDQATPATKTSLFSPHHVREILKPSNTGIVRSKVPPAFVLTQAQPTLIQNAQVRHGSDATTQDPFVSGPTLSATTQSSTDTSKLSPIASTFTPQSLVASSTASSVILSEPAGSVTLSPQRLKDLQAKLVGLAAPSAPSVLPSLRHNPLYKSSNRFENGLPSSTAEDPHSDGRSQPLVFKDTKQGSFSTDRGTSRCLTISQVATDCPVAAIEGFFSVRVHILSVVRPMANPSVARSVWIYQERRFHRSCHGKHCLCPVRGHPGRA